VGLSGTSQVTYPVIKTFKLAEQKGSYTPKPTWEEYGSRNWYPWHGARTSRKVEQHGNYIWLLTSEAKTDGRARVRETSPKHRLDNRPA